MQTPINKITNIESIQKHSLLTGAFLLLLVLAAKIDLDFGCYISFTLQTLILGLAYYFLPLQWRLVLIISYLCFGIAGLPVFNGGVGFNYFVSWPLGFFIGFVVAAAVPKPTQNSFIYTFGYFVLLHFIIVALGIIWLFYLGGSPSSPLKVALELLPGAGIKSLVGASVVTVSKNITLKYK
jgi:biotin transporter BioY